MSDSTVVPGQEVRVTSIARDVNGRGVPNLLVSWTWDFNGVRSTTRASTDANGRASSSRVISGTTTMVIVKVTARTQAGSTSRSSATSFRRVA